MLAAAVLDALLEGAQVSEHGLLITVRDGEHAVRSLRARCAELKRQGKFAHSNLMFRVGQLPTQIFIVRKDKLDAKNKARPGSDTHPGGTPGPGTVPPALSVEDRRARRGPPQDADQVRSDPSEEGGNQP